MSQLTAASIRRLITELTPGLVSYVDPEKSYDLDELKTLHAKDDELANRYHEGSKLELSLSRIEVKANPNDEPFIGKDKRWTCATVPLPFDPGPRHPADTWRLRPGQAYFGISQEFVTVPHWLSGTVVLKMTFPQGQCGFFCTDIAPGFSGTIGCMIHVIEGVVPVTRGALFCAVKFSTFVSDDIVKNALQKSQIIDRISQESAPYIGKRGADKHGTQSEIWGAF